MTSLHSAAQKSSAIDYPGGWDTDALRQQWLKFLTEMVQASESPIPFKRVQFQMEQSTIYAEIMQRWPKLTESERLAAWRKLIESSEQLFSELLPTCVQCGDCCRRGSPTLQLDDLELLRQGKIAWSQLVTLRKGEPVRSAIQDKLFFLIDERIKLRERAGTQQCAFHNDETDLCSIYADRPTQCRAQACWDDTTAKQVSEQPYLTRRDIFAGVELLLNVIGEHDSRCAFEKLHAAFKRLEESHGKSVDEVLELLAYEEHFRSFFAKEFNIPEDTLELVLGRSYSDLVGLFGFRITTEPDGTRCLVPDKTA